MIPPRLATAALLAAGLAPLAPAAAQEAAATPPAPSNTAASETAASDLSAWQRDGTPWWTLRFEASMYYVAPSGDLKLPGGGPGASTDTVELWDLNLDSPQIEPYGELHIARDRWRITIGGFGFQAEQSTGIDFNGQLGDMPFFAGERLETDFEFQSFEALAAYRVLSHASELNHRGDPTLAAGIDLLAGARFHRIDIDTRVVQPLDTRPAGLDPDSAYDGAFADIVGGARLDLDFHRTFGIDVTSAAGGFAAGDRSSFSFDITAGFVYRPVPNVGAQIGYRLLVLNLADGEDQDEFEYQGSFAGIYWGLILHF